MIGQKHWRVLFAAGEAVPFAKVGGLADMVSALSKALIEKKLDVRIIMPKYKCVTNYIKDHHIKKENSYVSSIEINNKIYSLTIEEVLYKENYFIFIDIPELFDRLSLYTDPKTGKDYNDNLERYTVFNKSILEACKIISWIPDIIHCHDWHMGLIPLYMEAFPEYQSIFDKTKSIFTIHNLSYQGVFPIEQYPQLGIDWKYYHINGLEYYRHINLMKAGIVFSDAVNTVSPTYAEEIQKEGFGAGLEGVIQEKKIHGIFLGIMNGVDYTEWSPKNDIYLKEKYGMIYDIDSLSKKENIKKKFAKDNHLSLSDKTPLIGIITRLYDQKGIDIFLECVSELVKQNIAFTILGTGKKEYEKKLLELADKFPTLMNVNIEFDIAFSHYIEAACDIFLMPSRFEPSGLNQLYSLRYGAVPVVRKTGGLADSVSDNKTGFLFSEYTPDELMETVLKAVNIWRNDKLAWEKIVKTCMKEDWSWKRSAKGYLELYKKILTKF